MTDFFHMHGEEIHEVAVGTGPRRRDRAGAFPLSMCRRARLHLEISLGYQHRGIERALVGGPNKTNDASNGSDRRRHVDRPCHGLLPAFSSRLAGASLRCGRRPCAAWPWSWNGWPATPATWAPWPTTSAFCRPPPIAAVCAAIFLNSTAMLCGNRFGRTMVRPGGVGWDLDPARIEQIRHKVEPALIDVIGATEVLRSSLSVQSRFEETGRVSRERVRAAGAGRGGGPGLRHRPRRAARFSLRHLSFRLHPGFDLGHRRRLCPHVRPRAGNRAVRAIRAAAIVDAAGRSAAGSRRPPGSRFARRWRWSRVGGARFATWR